METGKVFSAVRHVLSCKHAASVCGQVIRMRGVQAYHDLPVVVALIQYDIRIYVCRVISLCEDEETRGRIVNAHD